MSKKTILITWWTGYIWSHWVVAFEEAWYKTVIVDNFANSSIETLDWIEKIIWYKPDFYEVDLRDKNKLEKVFKKYDFDWVIHFAWLKAVWESCEKPLDYFDNNIVGSLKLFECMDKYNVKNIIFSSSATVYDSIIYEDNNFSWALENDLTWNTSNPYWTSKYILENILKDLSKFSWFNIVNLRYFNPIWAHPSWLIWEDPEWIPNNLLPYIMKVASWELNELKVFWNDYDTIDWTWVRDYIDVVDLIDWHLKSYKLLEKSSLVWFFESINLWVGKWVSVLEMIKYTEKSIWKKINYKIVSRRYWDLASYYCNPEKAKKILWWSSFTNIEKSIINSWKFYNK